MEKMYSMNDTLNERSKMSSPKLENILHSMFNAWNVIWERVTKAPASFMTSINYPLSVTLVRNEGIMSHDFFKDLTIKRDALNADSVYIHNTFEEQKLYVGRIFNESTIEDIKFNCSHIDINSKAIDRTDKNKSVVKGNSNYFSTTDISNKENIKELFEHLYLDGNENVKNIYNYEYTNNSSISNKKQSSDCIENTVNDNIIKNDESFLSITNIDVESEQMVKETPTSNMLTNMWQRVYSNITDRFCRVDSIETDKEMKRSHSPKQRRKYNTITKGRGRGRARSQLRRSGVSQTRHRKERTKHDLAADIQSDLKYWQDEDCYSLDEDVVDRLDTSRTVTCPKALTFADVKPQIQKPKSRKTCNQGMSKLSMRMRYVPECINIFNENFVESKYNSLRKAFRPRLVSESSIDSEDSSYVVFETESEVAYRSDDEYERSDDEYERSDDKYERSDDTDESNTDQTSDDDEDENETCNLNERVSPVQKVKFNLNPTVHLMIQWDYAYRAARRGPWEQMGRDRDRFKTRINCIERVLNPILTTEHRLRVWQERFAPID